MNNARMWTVVNPTVGLPLFFIGVALTSLTVHSSIMTNSDFMGQFWSGQEMGAESAALGTESPVKTVSAVSSITASLGEGEAFIVLPDGRTGRVVFDAPVTLAAADADMPPPAN
jgi:light-harvesting protein B-800-850 alpha chain